jgi:hypothetical protein
LTWLLQVSSVSSSTDTIEKITISHFSGFITDMGIDTGPTYPSPLTPAGSITPTNVEHSADGNVLRWDFNQGTERSPPGNPQPSSRFRPTRPR